MKGGHMGLKKCARCHGWFPGEEMLYIGKDECGSVFSCEGCLISNEQDQLYGYFPILFPISPHRTSGTFNSLSADSFL